MDCVGSQYKAARSLPEIIADRIIDLILEQGLKEGDRLPNERELCVIMKVGRSSLREAVRMLSSRNILMVRHGSGIYLCNHPGLSDDPFGFTFIRDKAKLVNDVAEFRMMVEPRIASMAACNGLAAAGEDAAIFSAALPPRRTRATASSAPPSARSPLLNR